MTTEYATKVGELSARLRRLENTVYDAKKIREFVSNTFLQEISIRFGWDSLYEIPKEIAKDALDLIIKKLDRECEIIRLDIESR